MEFVEQACGKESAVDLSSTFKKQALDAELFSKLAQSPCEIGVRIRGDDIRNAICGQFRQMAVGDFAFQKDGCLIPSHVGLSRWSLPARSIEGAESLLRDVDWSRNVLGSFRGSRLAFRHLDHGGSTHKPPSAASSSWMAS